MVYSRASLKGVNLNDSSPLSPRDNKESSFLFDAGLRNWPSERLVSNYDRVLVSKYNAFRKVKGHAVYSPLKSMDFTMASASSLMLTSSSSATNSVWLKISRVYEWTDHPENITGSTSSYSRIIQMKSFARSN